ncbi:flagellar type III secretion system pore protein FliP [Variovorax sp.]|uniref:flagellar type III secretion system pore protein FliP n=1 Tax=Variovorax sp. TaxID=1871043 RepID=UPI002D4A6485|nr:flagellar type III secretion system pore protein FliP [Variovorax sp.]HYP82989.1 flagellar type III secretion system pore protein FliP [Variovorax sp.]
MIYQNPGVLFWGLLLLSLMAGIFVLCTCFLKFTIVLNILKTTIGLQQAPPAMVINAFAIVLTLQTMHPVIEEVAARLGEEVSLETPGGLSINDGLEILELVSFPLRSFMAKNIGDSLTQRYRSDLESGDHVDVDVTMEEAPFADLAVLFVCAEITGALKIGMVLYLVFLAIDFVIASILQVVGMSQLQLNSIATPLKFLLIASADNLYRLLGVVSRSYSF